MVFIYLVTFHVTTFLFRFCADDLYQYMKPYTFAFFSHILVHIETTHVNYVKMDVFFSLSFLNKLVIYET